jgi:hypothetical protein
VGGWVTVVRGPRGLSSAHHVSSLLPVRWHVQVLCSRTCSQHHSMRYHHHCQLAPAAGRHPHVAHVLSASVVESPTCIQFIACMRTCPSYPPGPPALHCKKAHPTHASGVYQCDSSRVSLKPLPPPPPGAVACPCPQVYLRGALAKHLISCCFDPGSVRDVGAVYQLDVAEAGEGRGGWRKGAVCVWGGGGKFKTGG